MHQDYVMDKDEMNSVDQPLQVTFLIHLRAVGETSNK